MFRTQKQEVNYTFIGTRLDIKLTICQGDCQGMNFEDRYSYVSRERSIQNIVEQKYSLFLLANIFIFIAFGQSFSFLSFSNSNEVNDLPSRPQNCSITLNNSRVYQTSVITEYLFILIADKSETHRSNLRAEIHS